MHTQLSRRTLHGLLQVEQNVTPPQMKNGPAEDKTFFAKVARETKIRDGV
jgi:hypothetical protein